MTTWHQLRHRVGWAIASFVAIGLGGCSASSETANQEGAGQRPEFASQSSALSVSNNGPSAQPVVAGQRAVWVVLRQRAALAKLAKPKDWRGQGQAVVKSLTDTASQSQASVVAYLRGRGVPHKAYWIVNAVKVTADAATITALSSRPDVERVFDDYALSIPRPAPGQAQAVVDDVEWNIQNIRAPEAWGGFGTRGEGIVVANIDTGTAFDHPALFTQYRGNGAGGVDHNYSWYDPTGICGDEPCDNAGHGTHTMGTIVGDDGGANQIGVAPGARWIAAKGCEDFGCSLESLVAAGQWMLAPTDLNGNNPRPELRPNIVSNSWGGGGGDDFYEGVVQAWIAAGIFPVFSNGNSGSSCQSSGSPGDYPESYAVGAYDSGNFIAEFSSRGASVYGVTKPNISAPGVDVRSSVPGNGYDWYSGTSMAAPHVTGTVALLWSAAPAMVGDIALTRELLGAGALDHDDTSCGGEPGNNNVWGEGQLDVVASLAMAPIGPSGFLAGLVADARGGPIAGAALTLAGNIGRKLTVGADGTFEVRLPVGSYDLEARAFGYLTETVSGLQIDEDQTLQLNLVLGDAPTFAVSGTLVDGAGGALAGATVQLLGTPLEPATTDAVGAFVFPAVPAGEYSLKSSRGGCYADDTRPLLVDSDKVLALQLSQKTDGYGYVCAAMASDYIVADNPLPLFGDDDQVTEALPFAFPFYGASYSSVVITTNGYIAFDSPFPDYNNTQIPSTAPPNGAVYAMWDDLYLEDGEVYTSVVGESPDRQFVVEWRNVSFLSSGDRVSFEVILRESGEVVVQYESANLEDDSGGRGATIGIESPGGDDGIQFSYNKSAVRSGDSIIYSVPFAGFVEGVIRDSNDLLPIGGARVAATNRETGKIVNGTSSAAGSYRLFMTEGSYDLEVSKTAYRSETAVVEVLEGQTAVQDFTLLTPALAVDAQTIQLLLPENAVRERSIALANAGSLPLAFSIAEAGGRRTQVLATAKLERQPGHDVNAPTTRELYADAPKAKAKAEITPAEAGDVIRSFDTGLDLGWGIGQGDDLFISDVYAAQNVEFTTAGEATGVRFNTRWAPDFAADMAFDESRGLMCQVAVGGDNGIHCWDVTSGDVVAVLGGAAWTRTSQRGLAYNPGDDTFYVGGWGEGVIYTVAGLGHDAPGAVLSSCRPADGDISGLAYNGSSQVLWVATNSERDTIYQLNPVDCTVLSMMQPPQRGGYQGAGLEMDVEGNLWAVAQYPNKVYLVDSGVPAAGDIAWLTVSPEAGEVAPGEALSLTVSIDTAGLVPGLYLGSLLLRSNSGRQPLLRIPVSLVVSGYLRAVNAGGKDYTDHAGDLWARDKAYSNGSWGFVQRGRKNSTKHDISGTADPSLFQTLRENAYAYRYDGVPNGTYEIEFGFAELEAVRFGARLFDVIVEDTVVLPAHDIRYEVGRFAAESRKAYVEVADGRLDVRFIQGSGNKPPVINALRVTHRPDR